MPTRTFCITQFPNVRTTVGDRLDLSISDLAALLTAAPLVNTSDKTNAPCFTAGTFTENTRNKANFERASCLCLDFDGANHGALSDGELLGILETLNDSGVSYVVYTTYNTGLRVVLPLAEDVSNAQYTALYDCVARWFDTQPDKTGRTAERLHFLPQVPSEDAAARHMSEFVSATALLSLSVLAPARADHVFAEVHLSSVKVGTQKRCESFEDLERLLAASPAKQEDLNRYVFALASSFAKLGTSQEEFTKRVAPHAEAGLRANAVPVKDWSLAENTVIRAVADAYREAAPAEEPSELVPSSIEKRLLKYVKAGQLEEAGKLVAPYLTEEFTVDVAFNALEAALNAPDCLVTSLPDAEAAFHAGAEQATGHDWKLGLALNKDGRPDDTDANVAHILEAHPQVRGRFVRNVRTIARQSYLTDMPWGTSAGAPDEGDGDRCFRWMVANLCPGVRARRVYERLEAAFKLAPEHDPFLDYLNEQRWDGTDRLTTWLIDYCGVEDSEYARAVGRKWMISAVARTFKPGCQADSMLVFVSETQGRGKSTAIFSLIPNKEWCGSIKSLEERECPLKLSRYVVGVIEEIDRWGTKKSSGDLKDFVTEATAQARPAYARSEITLPRRGVLLGTSNHLDYLHDPTGGRRWWSVEVTKEIDREGLALVRDQMWAQAVAAYKSGEKWWFKPEEQINIAEPYQSELVTKNTPEAEALAQTMACLLEADRADVRLPLDKKLGKIPVDKHQMIGSRVVWLTELQVASVLKRHEQKNDAFTVKSALRAAGLRRVGKTKRWAYPNDHELVITTDGFVSQPSENKHVSSTAN